MDILLAIIKPITTAINCLYSLWYKLQKPNKHDIELYEKYKRLFIENNAARFYKQHDFQCSFKEEYWKPLSSYVDSWNSIEYEFVDKKLNTAHKKVYSVASVLAEKIAGNTYFIGEGSYMRSVKHDEILGETPDYIKENAQKINELAKIFNDCHESFVKLASSKLYNS